MELANWEATQDLNPIYAEARARELEQCIAEHDAFGFTVIPPEKIAPRAFHTRLRDAILGVHERRSGQHIDPADLASATLKEDRPLHVYYSLIGEDPVFEEALMNPTVLTMARYLCGKSVLLSDSIALVKQCDSRPTHSLHVDQAGTPPPMPPYPQVLNVTWALTDYTRDNGAVAIVPGSHRYGRMPMPYEKEFLKNDAPVRPIAVECEAGSLIIWGGTTWHGSWPRKAPGLRVNLIMTFCRTYMKQVRDFRSETPREIIDRNEPEFARLLGMDSLYPIDATRSVDPASIEAFTGAGRNPWA